VSRVPRLLVANRRHPERLASPRSSVFLGSVRSLSEAGHLAASLVPRVRQDSEAVDVDCRQIVGRRLKDGALITHLHEFAPVMRAGLLGRVSRVTAASRGMVVARMPARRGIAPLASMPDRQRRDGFLQPVIRCKHPVIPVPMLARSRDQIREPFEKLKRRELDDAVGPLPRGLSRAARTDRVDSATMDMTQNTFSRADFTCFTTVLFGHVL